MPKRVFESRSLNCSLFGRVAYGGEYYGRAAGSLAPGAEVSGSEPAELAPQSSIRIRITTYNIRTTRSRVQGPNSRTGRSYSLLNEDQYRAYRGYLPR